MKKKNKQTTKNINSSKLNKYTNKTKYYKIE